MTARAENFVAVHPLVRTRTELGIAIRAHAPEVKVCRPCRGKGVDRFGFDCTTCLGTGEVDE